jgi:hypothetical protein
MADRLGSLCAGLSNTSPGIGYNTIVNLPMQRQMPSVEAEQCTTGVS